VEVVLLGSGSWGAKKMEYQVRQACRCRRRPAG
jgi:hypothetical protein